MIKILFLAPYPLEEAPSQRFRFEQYFSILKKHGFQYDFQSFLTLNGWQALYKKGGSIQKLLYVALGFLRRFKTLFTVGRYHFVFIHRELSPLGPPIFEWIIAKIFRKKIIYDFDDAIWMADEGDLGGVLLKLKWHRKVASICRWSYKVSCGNEHIRQYALQFNANSFYNPTTIDTQNVHNRIKEHSQGKVKLGWTGTHSTLKFLETLWPVLKEIEEKYDTDFVLIANRKPNSPLKNLEFISWNKNSEIEDLLKMDIGIMPLVNDAWNEGKCGFKALQYMSLGIPAVASPFGVNKTIIQDGVNGYLSTTNSEWLNKIGHLIQNKKLRSEIGTKGKETVEKNYSVLSNETNFLALFE